MLKHITSFNFGLIYGPAAFRRLCVETAVLVERYSPHQPAAFRRLCVETRLYDVDYHEDEQPPSGGCVLKQFSDSFCVDNVTPAAFRRLCVETPPGLVRTLW